MAENMFAAAAAKAQERGGQRTEKAAETIKSKTGGWGEKIKGLFTKVKDGAVAAEKFLAGGDVFIGAVVSEGAKRTQEWGKEQWNKTMEAGERVCERIDKWGEKTGENINQAADWLGNRVREVAGVALVKSVAMAERYGKWATNTAETGIKVAARVESRVADIVMGPQAFVAELRSDFDQARAGWAEARAERVGQTTERKLQTIESLSKGGSEKVRQRADMTAEKTIKRSVASIEKHEAARDAARAQAEKLRSQAAQLREKQSTMGFFRRALANL